MKTIFSFLSHGNSEKKIIKPTNNINIPVKAEKLYTLFILTHEYLIKETSYLALEIHV